MPKMEEIIKLIQVCQNDTPIRLFCEYIWQPNEFVGETGPIDQKVIMGVSTIAGKSLMVEKEDLIPKAKLKTVTAWNIYANGNIPEIFWKPGIKKMHTPSIL